MPRSQRSHEEVEAEKASKAQATADAAQKYNDAIALIAAHEAQQKADAAQEEANAVLSLEDLDPDDTHSNSDAGRVEDDDAYLSTGEFDKPAKVVSSFAS
jgi:hypothetical protein